MAPTPKLWSARFVCPAADAELLAAAFEDSSENGALALTVTAPPRKPTAEIEALFGTEPNRAALSARLAVVAMMHKLATPDLVIAEVPSLDWLQKVAADFPPLPIARWIVHGAQHRDKVPNRLHALQIDATSAFGTGEHPTTRGCLLTLDATLKRTGRKIGKRGRLCMLDMGCGSGILAMAAMKSTYGRAVAVDMDALSITVARENLRLNGLSRHITARVGRGYRPRQVKQGAPYDLIMSNIFARPLAEIAKDLKKVLRPGGEVILAGLLNHQANQVIAAHRLQHIYVRRKMRIGEWTILALHRPHRAQSAS